MKPVKVDSSNITALGYQNGDLYVRFKGSGVYKYKDVPAAVAAFVVFADSVGSALNTQVKKPGYAFEKLEVSPFDDDVALSAELEAAVTLAPGAVA